MPAAALATIIHAANRVRVSIISVPHFSWRLNGLARSTAASGSDAGFTHGFFMEKDTFSWFLELTCDHPAAQ